MKASNPSFVSAYLIYISNWKANTDSSTVGLSRQTAYIVISLYYSGNM